MTTTQKHESLRLAEVLDALDVGSFKNSLLGKAAAKLRRQHSRIAELEAARIAYASEFEPDADGDPDVGNIHANIRALKAKLAATKAADAGNPVSTSATVSDEYIKAVFLANGFTIKEGMTDLKPYVYQAARALLASVGAGGVEPLRKRVAAPQAVQAAVPETREALAKRLIADVQVADTIATAACQRVAELPDRDSPADWPEAMLVTGDELHMIVREAVIEAQAKKGEPKP